jgi:hypothetical protein
MSMFKMKYTKLWLPLGVLMLVACTDLDTSPRQSITPDIALSDLAGYESLVFSMYNRAIEFDYYGQTMMIGPEILADNLRILANTGRYVGEEANADREHIDIWNEHVFGGINDANMIIAGIDNEELTGDEDWKKIIKGEAYFMRALFYFDLSRVYGYEPGREVNNYNLGPILRLEPTTQASDADFRARATNVQVYEQIEADLLNAIEVLPFSTMGRAPSETEFGVYRANWAAALTLLARLYLYWDRMSEAEEAATAAMRVLGLSNNGVGLVPANTYVDAFSTAPHPESIFELEIRAVDWNGADGVNNSLNSLTSNSNSAAQFVVGASDELMDSYEEGDVRKNTWRETTAEGVTGTAYASRKWTGFKGDFLENLPILRASELYLIRAEARYATNPAGARADLNALRSRRGLGPVDGVLTGQALLNRILMERRLEFALEGHRFFDFKRNGRNISKHGSFMEVPYTDYRILSDIPLRQVELNHRLEQNPGY